MSERQLSLPDDVYQGLLTAAVMEGMTPAAWIAAHVPPVPTASQEQPSLYDVLADLAGVISGEQDAQQQMVKTVVGEAIAAKLAKH